MKRRFPIGAEPMPGGGVDFRVWAADSKHAAVVLYPENGAKPVVTALQPEPGGYFAGIVPQAAPGSRYKLRIDHGEFPDPASRFQPEGPHGPSEVVAAEFAWTDADWRGRPAHERVIYEMHLGTFTMAGTWRAAMAELPQLARLGVTVIEVMPVAEFPGEFGWGYDGVNLFAPSRLYGTPADVRAFVNRAHVLGLLVILDVVYNHVGPDGNYLTQFARSYFNPKYSGEWGDPINFDGDGCRPVREYFITNAAYWIAEFHLDGLRLDATQQIFDRTKPHVIADIVRAARAAAPQRTLFIIGENEPQDANLLRPIERGGCGLDALWNDDFHHCAMVAATGRSEAYYNDYAGTAQELVSAIKHGFLYQGQLSRWQQQRRGAPAFDLPRQAFVVFLQNHDQVANSLRGLRLHQLTSPGRFRALTALMLLAPQVPLLFQGQEFAASAPFLYFADHNPELGPKVAAGRREFLRQFSTIAAPECAALFPPPHARENFQRSKLDLRERETHREAHALHEDLLRLRREDSTIARPARVEGAVLSRDAFVLRYFAAGGDDRLLLVNLGADLHCARAPEPLLAPVAGCGWRVRWSSEMPKYGGGGTPPLETTANWIIHGQSAVLMQPNENDELPAAKFSQKD